MMKRILAAVDASPRSKTVLDAALELAERFDAHVHLYRVIAVPQEFPPAAHVPPDTLGEYLVREATRGLTELAAERARVTVEPPDVAPVQPWRAIIATAQRLSVDLIVIGSHGYGGWDRVLGTTASRVADRADRSVLVVHERKGP